MQVSKSFENTNHKSKLGRGTRHKQTNINELVVLNDFLYTTGQLKEQGKACQTFNKNGFSLPASYSTVVTVYVEIMGLRFLSLKYHPKISLTFNL